MSEKKYFFDGKDESYTEIVPNPLDQSLAELFTEQVEAFYSLPRNRWQRKEVYFSPSGVTNCARHLFYENTNAPLDEIELIAWKERLSRNGTGSHDVTQADYLKMEEKLNKAGIPVKFRFLEPEIKGEKSYKVGQYTVKLRGRSDGRLALLNDEGEVETILGWEKKTKDKRKNLNKIMKDGRVQDTHRQQAVAYFLIWGIDKWIFEYEALQKPEWNDNHPEKPDIAHFYVEVDKDEAKALLIRLAKIVKAVEENTIPEPELDKCNFCPFKTQCHKDGGYKL
jgi:CRISPR/Cas system-associated exonuclease Cas4 (RecB family)